MLCLFSKEKVCINMAVFGSGLEPPYVLSKNGHSPTLYNYMFFLITKGYNSAPPTPYVNILIRTLLYDNILIERRILYMVLQQSQTLVASATGDK